MGWKTAKTKGAAKIRTIMKRDGNHCWLCGEPFSGASGRKPSLDHVIPRSKGGSDRNENLKLAHTSCNNKRGDKLACLIGDSSPELKELLKATEGECSFIDLGYCVTGIKSQDRG